MAHVFAVLSAACYPLSTGIDRLQIVAFDTFLITQSFSATQERTGEALTFKSGKIGGGNKTAKDSERNDSDSIGLVPRFNSRWYGGQITIHK
eukprot:scaffold3134_cov155-Skeletonema_marinoi.AAC.4